MFLISPLKLLYLIFEKTHLMSWQPGTSSIINNTHILESFHMYLFLESINHLVPQLK